MRSLVVIFGLVLFVGANAFAVHFPWLGGPTPLQSNCVADIKPPDGFERVEVDTGSYAEWLRALPLTKAGSPLLHYDGKPCHGQNYHYRIIDIDVGDRDLQQCADAVIRLRAEYLYSRRELNPIAFNFTSGDRARFTRWARGYRPRVRGNNVRWVRRAKPDSSYASFRDYLYSVFTYAGTYSLDKEMVRVPKVADIRAGDCFIRGGFPGHVLMVVDIVRNKKTRQTAVLLAQSIMPAHEIHIVKNVRRRVLSPWYLVADGDPIRTRFYAFESSDLKRFGEN